MSKRKKVRAEAARRRSDGDGGGAAPARPPSRARLTRLCRHLLLAVGEDPDRQGLRRTPLRMARALDYLTRGYREDPAQVVGEALFEVANQEMVIVRNIELYSLCEHHMLPFFGKAHVGYIPDGKVVGLSKIARLVEVFSRRLQVQERLTQQIADSIMELIRPLGVAVVVEAHHMCMMMRGVEKQSSTTLTSAMLGTFRTNPSTRAEFLNLIRGVHRPIM